MTNFTNEQLEAWAGLGDLYVMIRRREDGATYQVSHSTDPQVIDTHAMLFAAAPDIAAALLAERKAREVEVANLKGLAWIAYHEFNAINARSGGPLDQYGMVTVTHEYWQAITDLLAKAAGETTPWPTDSAKAIFEQIERERKKDQPHD